MDTAVSQRSRTVVWRGFLRRDDILGGDIQVHHRGGLILRGSITAIRQDLGTILFEVRRLFKWDATHGWVKWNSNKDTWVYQLPWQETKLTWAKHTLDWEVLKFEQDDGTSGTFYRKGGEEADPEKSTPEPQAQPV